MAINLNFNKLPWHAQLGSFAALGIALAGAFWYFYAAAAQDAIGVRQTELQSIRAEIDRGLAQARSLPKLRSDVKSKEAELERLKQVLPDERDVAELLRKVQGMATQSNLVIRGFEPRAVTNQELHAEWPIGLKLEGNYHDLGAFLERVSKFPRIINVGSIKIAAKEGQGGGNTITAECTATTFVLIEKSKPAPAKPKGAQAAAHTTGSGVTL